MLTTVTDYIKNRDFMHRMLTKTLPFDVPLAWSLLNFTFYHILWDTRNQFRDSTDFPIYDLKLISC